MSEVFIHRARFEAPAADVYAWLARQGALERLTPPWERIEVIERGQVREGSRTVLRVWVGPARFRWVAVHRDVEPGKRFRDEQAAGPFARWLHTHDVKPEGPEEACVLEDRVAYDLPLGAAGRLAAARLVRGRLQRLFASRERTLGEDLALHRRAGLPPLRVAVSGASGFLGGALVPLLTTGGHHVVRLVRPAVADRPRPRTGLGEEVEWDPARGRLDPDALRGIEAFVHLSGAPVAGRWTAARRREIRESRVASTRLLAEALAALPDPPRVLVTASAIGFYGDRGMEELDESSPPGRGFLPDVCRDWEAATEPAARAGVRVVRARFGVVLGPGGGALRLMLPAFKLGLGGRLGSGRQWTSWVTLDDAAAAVLHALADETLRGPMNVVAPGAVTNAELTRTLARVLGRPAPMRVPAQALRLALGDMADEALLASALVLPRRLRATAFHFRDPELEPALRAMLGRPAGR